ncbi:hypothetical protein VPG91_00265 [Nitrospirillum amazonense]|uniref:hypothetical protein n=1 Tax=Nitrospirillum amazonense TaxID=28077 RepID=UPI002DD42845|nr:hypothetical protein [Nitrospirillum amazonense]MEC4589409.1 hypothetical protein [Nitrospirillum amazonense]
MTDKARPMLPLRWLLPSFLALALAAALMAQPAVAAKPQGTKAAPGDGPQGIANLNPIALEYGVNTLDNFAPDGRTAIVIRAWRDNGNAWGHATYMVMMKPAGGDRHGWNLVSVEAETPPGVAEIVRDSPHTGEDALRSVVFAHGTVEGKPQTLLLIATRKMGDSVPDPAPTTIAVYQLTANAQDDDPVGTTPDTFRRIRSWQTKKPYCSSDAALATELYIPRPADSEAPETADGCS